VALAGCGYAKRKDVDAQFTQLKTDMETADQNLDSKISQVDTRVNGLESRTQALERDLQSMRDEFGTAISRFDEMLSFNVPVNFEYAKADLRQVDESVLNQFAEVVKKYYPNALVTVEGFTDPAGSRAYNLRLGKQRAEAVRDYLVTSAGPTAEQVRAVSYGEATDRLVAPKAQGPGNEGMQNRRAALVIDFSAKAMGDRAVTMNEISG
jgi:peptidoglycan-associated lipoprotein